MFAVVAASIYTPTCGRLPAEYYCSVLFRTSQLGILDAVAGCPPPETEHIVKELLCTTAFVPT